MISKCLSGNSRFGRVSLEAEVLYSLALAHGDRDGRLSADPDDILDEVVPAVARDKGWDVDMVTGLREELHRAQLWLFYVDHQEREVAAILRWEKHQRGMRYDREAPSRFGPPPAPGSPPGTRGPDPEGGERAPADPEDSGQVRSGPDHSGSEPDQSGSQPEDSTQMKGIEQKGRGRGKAPPAPPSPPPPDNVVAGCFTPVRPQDVHTEHGRESLRIRMAFMAAMEAESHDDPEAYPRASGGGLKPREVDAADTASTHGTCLRWADADLVEEFRRTMRGLVSKGYTDPSLQAVVNHVGETWDGQAPQRPAPGPSAEELREDMAAAAGVTEADLVDTRGGGDHGGA